ncbi:MAG TPA: diacylglyceryl transferase [Flavobacteriales bacterium]|nr:diacylglyceryl transferase [Flavobacteriales bacterium]
MYPNLYYAFLDLFGIDLPFLKLVNSFGFFVAMAFLVGGYIISLEFTRLTSLGVFKPNHTEVITGKPATLLDIAAQAFIGFLFGWKFLYLAINAGTIFNGENLPQSHLFSSEGSIFLGVTLAIILGGWKWWEARKNALPVPKLEKTVVLPKEHVGGILTVAAIGGILGAKLFHLIEYPEQFVAFFKAPSLNAFLGGLTIYGGLFVGGLSVYFYARHHGLKFLNVADSSAPALMLGYGIGRIGCQISGDGDWGIANPAPQPNWLSWLPEWTWSYSFPNNVNGVGRFISESDPWSVYPGYGTCLDPGVYPTSLYETSLTIILFAILWKLRTRFTTAGLVFATYLMMNGLERFFIEKIRVNTTFDMLGITMTQAELISTVLFIGGAVLFYVLKSREGKNQLT